MRYDPNEFADVPAFARAAASEYEKVRPHLALFEGKVRALVDELLRGCGLRFAAIDSRVKSVESFEAKARKPDPQNPTVPRYDEPSRQIRDQLGVRIVCYLVDDIPRIEQLIRDQFLVLESTERSNEAGYRSLHMIVRLNEARAALAENASFKESEFELQIRTVLQHAWAEIEHDLGYKTEPGLPKPLRRRFLNLSGLLEVADREFQELQSVAASSERALVETMDRSPAAEIEITPSVLEYVVRKEFGGNADSEVLAVATRTLGELGYVRLPDLLKDIENTKKTQTFKQLAAQYSDPVVRLYAVLAIVKGPDLRRALCDPTGSYAGWEPFFDSVSAATV